MSVLRFDGLMLCVRVNVHKIVPVPSIADLLTYARIPPAVNQIELHPYLSQENLLTYMNDQKIHATAYSPLGRPGQHKLPELLDDPVRI
jgi:alcohol dehydrogenase (NADP+)